MSLQILRRIVFNHSRYGCNLSNYKSSISLDNLYPSSSLSISKLPQIPVNEEDKFCGYIPMDKLKISYSKSSGPGGQNVNRLNTKCELRFQLSSAEWIPKVVRENMQTKYRNQVNKEGCLILNSDRTRSQHLNTADALEKLREMIRACEPIAVAEPSPETLEKIRRRQEKSVRERLREKRARHDVKGSRGAV